jgi:membrane fusion protein (multidrug efflux system)
MRSLADDGFNRSLAGLLLATALLGGWAAWFLLSRVAVYAVTQTARLEVDRAAHPVEAPVAGRVVMTRLVVGQEVQAGEVLVELDAQAQRLQLQEQHARLAALAAQLTARRKEVTAEEAAWQGERQAALVALDEARARLREAEVAVRSAAEEAEFYARLQIRGLAAQLDLVRTKAEVHKRRAAADTFRLAVGRLEGEQHTREHDRLAHLERFQREIVQIEGDMATAAATVERLGHELEQRRIQAPVAGRLGEVAALQIGAVVRQGDTLGAILPPSALKIVARFPPHHASQGSNAGGTHQAGTPAAPPPFRKVKHLAGHDSPVARVSTRAPQPANSCSLNARLVSRSSRVVIQVLTLSPLAAAATASRRCKSSSIRSVGLPSQVFSGFVPSSAHQARDIFTGVRP